MKLTKRLLAMLLTVVMVLTMLPAIALTASAADTTETLTASDFAATGTSYAASSGVSKGGTARYAAYTAKNSSNIQFNKKQNCYIVSTTSGGKVKSVTVTIASGSQAIIVKGSNTAYTTSNAYSNGTEIARGTSTFTATPTTDYEYFAIVGNANGAVYISSVQVVWTSGASKTLSSIALSGTYPTTFTQGDTFSHDGMTVTATYSDSTTANVTSSATFSGYNMSTTGNQTVTVSYTEGGTTKTATYGITVNAPTPASITLSRNGTTETPSGTYYVGDSYTLPGAGADVNGHKHVGWSTVTVPTPGSKPTTNYYELGAEIPSLGASQTYYAVYAIQEGSGNTETRWKLASTMPASGSTVIFAGKDSSGNYYAMNNADAAATYVSCTAITVADDMIDKNTTTTSYEWVITSGVVTSNSTEHYLCLNSSSLRVNSTGTNRTTDVSIDGNGYTVIHRSNNTKYVVFNSSSNGFGQSGTAASTATTAVYMFTQQEVGGATYSGYTTAPQAPVNPTYSVTVASGITGGSVSASPATAEQGDTITVTATPNTGYELTALTYTPAGGSATNINGTTFSMPAANVTVNATFSEIDYTITKSATNGTITAAATANYNDSVSFTVAPNSGYQIDSVTVTDASSNNVTVSGSNGSYSFTMPASNVTITATCSALPTYDYTFYGPNNSTVATGNAASVTAPAGSPASITYTYPGETTPTTFTFAGWVAGQAQLTTPGAASGEIIPAGTSITLSADTTYRAVYAAAGSGDTFTLSLDHSGTTYYVGPRSGSNSYMTAETSAENAAEFGIDESNGSKYLYYMDGTDKVYVSIAGNSTSLSFASAIGSATAWTVTESSGTIYFTTTATGGRNLAYNYNNGSPRFASYTGSSTYLYQFTKTGGAAYLTEPGANYYAVTYNENAGGDTVTNMPDNGAVQENTSYTIPATIPVRDGYRFDGWATSASGSVAYAAASLPATISSVSAAVNLYAKWTLRATVTFYDTDNTTIFDTVYTYAGETPTAPASNPTKADSDPHYYTFAGWSRTAGGTVESPLAVIGSSESTRAYYPVFTEHTRIEAVDDSFVLDFDRDAKLNVLANDRYADGATLTLGAAPTGITLTKNNDNTVTFGVPGGQLTTATYTFTYTLSKSGETDSTATVTVKPSSAIYYEDNNTDFFTYNDGEDGTWSEVGIDNAWLQDASAAADGFDAANNSLTWSAGVAHKANVVFDEDKDRDWPTMEFTFVGNAFSISMMRNNYTGLIAVYVDGTKVKNLPTAYGATGGEYDPEAAYGGFIYESSDSNYGMPAFYWAADGGTVGTHSVKVEVLYSSMYDHNNPKAGNYDVYIDGVTIYNPISGSTAYKYISFRDTVLASGSLGVPTTTPHNYVATLSPASLSLNTGNTGVLQLSLTDENVPVYSGYTVVYTSSNPSIATVTPAGSLNATTGVNTATVTGVSAGQATITATITTPGSTTLTRTATVIVSETGKTVNYYVNGTVWDSEQVAEGNDPSFTAPAASTYSSYDAHDYTFLGWIPSTISPDSTEAPATIYEAGDTYAVSANLTFHAVFSYAGETSGSGFTLSYTNSGTTYYLGTDNSSGGVAVSTDSSNAATYGMEQIGSSEYYYLYYLNGADKIYLTGNTGSSSSTRTVTFSDANTQPSSGYYKWYIDSNNKFVCNNGSSDGGALQINTSDKTYAKMYTSAQWGAFTQTAASGVSATYYATTLNAATPVTHDYAASITPSSLALHPGETGSVSATLTDNGATVSGATPTYTTSDASVATVAADGTVTAVGNGSATITATYTVGGNDYTATCAVTVTTLATYTVTYMVNGSQYGETESVTQGSSPSFTAPSYDVSGYNAHAYEFLGWKEGSALSGDTTEAQTLYVAGNTHVISGNTTYYAVYCYTEGGSATTAIGDLARGASADYVIAAHVGSTYYAMSNTFASKIDGTSITTTGSSVSSSDATGYAVTITKDSNSDTEVTIKSGSTYLTYASSTNLGTSSSAYTWTISSGTKGTYRLTSETAGRGLVYRADTTNKFGGYSTGNVTANGTEYYDVEIIPVGGSGTTYYATTLNVASAHTYVASITSSVTLTAGNDTTLAGTLTDNGITTTAYAPTYTSSDTSVVTVDSSTGYTAAISAGTATITVSYSVSGTTYSATCAVTVNAVSTEYAASYAVQSGVTYSGNGRSGNTITLPTAVSIPASYDAYSYTLVGWATATGADDTTKPTCYDPGDEVTITDDTTFYPVYSYSVGGGNATYNRITSTSDLTSGAKYLIVSETGNRVMKSSNSSSTLANTYDTLTLDGSGTVTATSTLDGYAYTYQNSGFYGTNEKYISGTSGSNTINFPTSAAALTISFSGNNAVITSNTSVLRDNTGFRFYKAASSGTGNPVQLYKYTAGSGGGTLTYTFTLAASSEVDNYVGSVSVSPSSVNIGGNTATLSSSLTNNGETVSSGNYTVSYAITSGTAATLSGTTLTSGSSAGTVTVTATFQVGGNTVATATCELVVVDPNASVTVNYVGGSTGYVYNWGTRGEAATFLTAPTSSYYTGSYSYSTLSALSGSSTATAAAIYQSDLGTAIHNMLAAKQTSTTSYDGTKTLYKYTDCVGSNTSYMSSFYSGTQITNTWDSGSTWNREHTWPNSKGLNSSDENDIMMLRPTSVSENSSRGNTAYGQSSSYYNPNSEATSGLADLRGDIARLMLQHLMRWGNTSYFYGTSGVIESRAVLLSWMEADPVDTWEMGRNDAVQRITGVRNVFVDYPELAFILLGASVPSGYTTPSSSGIVATATYNNTYNGSYSPVTRSSRIANPGVEYAVMDTDPVTETRGGATRAVGDENTSLPVTGAVMLNGIGQISNNDDVMNYLASYGAQNCLVIPASGSVVFYLTGGSAESQIAIGASALNGTGTTLKVYQISAVSGSSATGTILVEQSLVSSTEMYFAINGIAWTGEKSNVLMVRNEGSAPMLLTNLRAATGTVEGHISTGGTESVGGATRAITRSTDNELQMVIDASAILAGIAGVQSINEGTFDETPVDPVDPIDPIESDIVFRGNSISLNGQIDVNFYVDVPADLLASGVYATLDGVRADFTEGTYGTMVSKKLPAKEMNTKVTLKLYAADGTPLTFLNGGAAVTEHSYSVQDYLTYVIGNPATYGDELVKLCKAMSDYGSYTQRALDFDVENAKSIYLADEIAAVTCEGCGYSFTPNTENITFLGASVVTESETAIRVYFALTGEGFTATVDGEPAAIQTNERGTFVEVANISAKNLGDTHTIAITNGTETVTVSDYSAYSYVQSVLSYAGASDSLKLAAKALKLYGDLAAAYFNK